MAYVNPSTQSIKTCFQSRYSLPYFQREYKWESKHFIEMLNDIQNSFLLSYEPHHGRQEVSRYAPYFLGSIITSSPVSGKKPLIDGQQRLTSAFLILAYLERYRKDASIQGAYDLQNLLGNTSFGEVDYSIEFSTSRRAIFHRYLDRNTTPENAMTAAEDVDGLDDGDKKILEAFRATSNLLNERVRDAIAYFIDYVIERVLLIDISVDSEAEAHRVFVTMNDRGLKLGPIDLLKGQILSKITAIQDSRDCHDTWSRTVNRLKDLGPEEDSLFFRNFFRARWADSIRGKNKGDPPGDFDIIGDAYHRWFEQNLAKISLTTTDDYVRFSKDIIQKYAEIYIHIKDAEGSLRSGFDHLYYNSIRRYGFQSMVLLSCVRDVDVSEEWKRKISLVSRYLDLILTSRISEGKDNNYDNLKDMSFQIARDIRNKSYDEILAYVRAEWEKHPISALSTLKYTKSDRSDLLYVLARLSSYLEERFATLTKVGFEVYCQRDRGQKTFDIEHLLKAQFDTNTLPADHGFADGKDYADSRNLLGALALLPRSRNRALQDKPYKEKLEVYATENVLVQTLASGYYVDNTVVRRFMENYPNTLGAIPDFGKPQIEARTNLYMFIANTIWACP